MDAVYRKGRTQDLVLSGSRQPPIRHEVLGGSSDKSGSQRDRLSDADGDDPESVVAVATVLEDVDARDVELVVVDSTHQTVADVVVVVEDQCTRVSFCSYHRVSDRRMALPLVDSTNHDVPF